MVGVTFVAKTAKKAKKEKTANTAKSANGENIENGKNGRQGIARGRRELLDCCRTMAYMSNHITQQSTGQRQRRRMCRNSSGVALQYLQEAVT